MGSEFSAHELLRNLGEEASTIPRTVSGTRTPVIKTLNTLDGEVSEAIRRDPVTCSDKTDATGVVLEPWI